MQKIIFIYFEFKKPKKQVVYLGGRPRVMNEIAKKADAVIIGLLPGNRGGEAIADIIFNDYNPVCFFSSYRFKGRLLLDF